mgnify:CR=1 FL=1
MVDEKKLKNLPEDPGVYIMKDKDGRVIYVGKAKILKNRVRQYFHTPEKHPPKVRAMVEKIDTFEYILTDSELVALVLECNLIKKFRPYYNILLKDDKNYPYIKVTNEEFPRFKFVRKMEKDGAKYFGPFQSAAVVREVISFAQKTFKIPSCEIKLPKDMGKKRACINAQIGMCCAPCENIISKEEIIIPWEKIKQIGEESLVETITYISHQSYIFKGTVRDNLLMGCPAASDEELWEVLDRVNLLEFLKSENGLDTKLNERASNLSGGQCQRLALARALLHDSRVYIFDEATSNIDMESENDIISVIHGLVGSKTIILISHRLANVTASDNIYVMENGNIAETGNHEELLNNNNVYAKLWYAQQNLENYGKERTIV